MTENDFVHTQINSESKVANMRRIRDALNMNLKDFVYIDNRADQREIVGDASPDSSPRRDFTPSLARLDTPGAACRMIPKLIEHNSTASASDARTPSPRNPRT